MHARSIAATALIRVVVVDDSELVRAGVTRVLGPEDGFEVVGECADGGELLDVVRATEPDVVVMELRLTMAAGLRAIRTLAARSGAPPVLVFTTADEDELLWGAVAAGASGLVLKGSPVDDLITATRAVAGGAAWFDAGVVPLLLEAFR